MGFNLERTYFDAPLEPALHFVPLDTDFSMGKCGSVSPHRHLCFEPNPDTDVMALLIVNPALRLIKL